MATVNVLVRARPLNKREEALDATIILKMEKQKTFLNYAKTNRDENQKDKDHNRNSFSQKQFLFDRAFWSVDNNDGNYTDQIDIYNEFGANVVSSAMDGYNACVFAYGLTGSGKTYTMIGTEDNKGLIPRICESLFKRLNRTKEDPNTSFRVEVSYMEIYNEQVRDLLRRKTKKSSSITPHLKVREHPKEGPFVQDLTIHPVCNYTSIESLLEEGNSVRITASTSMNNTSSRSHAIFTVKLSQAKFYENIPSETVSKVNLVDLAGSERAALSGASGIRLKEGSNINNSLVTLGLVISALAENSVANKNASKISCRQIFVPYRDSTLTWLLKDSIGGNSKTIMIGTVSPADIHYGDTLSTLRYASRARKIINKPVINEDPNVKIIRELQAEIKKLREMVAQNSLRGGKNIAIRDVSSKMEAKLKENEEKAQKLTQHWLNKTKEAQKIFEEKCMTLSRHGQQTVLTSAKPHLVGLDVDPLSTDIVIYHLDEGTTVIGSCDLSEEQGIALEGSGIDKEHCRLEVSPHRVVLQPVASLTYINERLIETSWELCQGDVVQFGHFLKFRFNNPWEAAKLREKRRTGKFSPMSGRFSPAVMRHYRSLDSGLNSPEDFENNMFQSELVMNSTTVSSERKSVDLETPAKGTDEETMFPSDEDSLILNKTNLSGLEIDFVGMNSFSLNNQSSEDKKISLNQSMVSQFPATDRFIQKKLLKSKSASNMLIRREIQTLDQSAASLVNVERAGEIYLSSDNILNKSNTPSRLNSQRVSDPDILNLSNLARSARKAVSMSDLSLSTDDLEYNLLLQSQLNSHSSSSSLYSEVRNHFGNTPLLVEKTQSLCDMSPSKIDRFEDAIVRADSLYLMPTEVFQEEQLVIQQNQNSSMLLAHEAKEAASALKEKREELKALISKYRNTEIMRVETEKENIRRAAENEKIFMKQQNHLEELFKQQKIQLEEARQELEQFKKTVIEEKEIQRREVEKEVNGLMDLKQKHLGLIGGSEHDLRKTKFKLKVKIEDYWKRMDLYDNLLIELELDQNKVKRETEGKVQEKMKLFEMQQTEEINSLREQIKISEELIENCKTKLHGERIQEQKLIDDFETVKSDFQTKILDAEELYEHVKEQEERILSDEKEELLKFDEEIAALEEKYFKFTIYKVHECDSSTCSDQSHAELASCKLTEGTLIAEINEIKSRKQNKETFYDERKEKCKNMIEDTQFSKLQLQGAQLIGANKYDHCINSKQNLIVRLENQLATEQSKAKDYKHELKAYERPRSYISDCPEETEEDIIALEQQKEQLIQSKEKKKTILENTLQEEFSDLKNQKYCPKSTSNLLNLTDEMKEISSVDQALSLIFRSGNSAAYTNTILNKHLQYEGRKQLLSDIKDDLKNLMKNQIAVHHKVATNFLTQKSVFEELRSQERQDIHQTIQTLIGENDSNDEIMFTKIFAAETERILTYQERLDTLEQEMYGKFLENQAIQHKLNKIQEAMENGNIEADVSLNKTLAEQVDALQVEKEKCEFMVQELRKKLVEERKEYLDILKSKDEYEIIGQEYRDARHTLFQTEGNQAAAEVLHEVLLASNALESTDKTGTNVFSGGWRYVGKEKNINLFRKITAKRGCLCVIGQGIAKAAPKDVWEAVKNPLSRLVYDNMVKKINIVEHCSDQLKVVYLQHESRICFLKQSRDCCCINSERIENNKYVTAFKSVEHPDCPKNPKYGRSNVLPSGWVVESYTENGEDWSMMWYLLKIDLGKNVPKYFINSLAQKIPLSISYLSDYLVLS